MESNGLAHLVKIFLENPVEDLKTNLNCKCLNSLLSITAFLSIKMKIPIADELLKTEQNIKDFFDKLMNILMSICTYSAARSARTRKTNPINHSLEQVKENIQRFNKG